MEKRSKIVLIAVLIAIALLSAFFLFMEPLEPVDEMAELRAVWNKYGIKADYLNNAFDELEALELSDLRGLKQDLEFFSQKTESEWLSGLSLAYSNAIGIEESARRINELRDRASRLAEPCEKPLVFREILSEQKSLLGFSQEYSSAISTLSSEHSVEFEKTGLPADIDSADLEKAVEIQKAFISLLEEECN